MKIVQYPSEDSYSDICQRPVIDFRQLNQSVSSIIEDVKKNGDKALLKYTKQFDLIDLQRLTVDESEIKHSGNFISDHLKEAISVAIKNIDIFHKHQFPVQKKIETMPGVQCWQKAVPIERIGLYIPGGSSPLISSVLMLGVPARVAGCAEIILCSPPGTDGTIHPAILYAAGQLNIKKIFKAGGAQAIAAMAFGTESIPKVDKIFGPGNQYVTIAKQLMQLHDVAIDLPAGPSEVAIVADKTADPEFIASDLLAQAEHGLDSQVLLVTTEETLIEPVQNALKQQLASLPRRKIAGQSLNNSAMVLLNSVVDVIKLINQYAPEHLILMVSDPENIAARINNAGSIFLGPYTPEAAGDYASGTNHTLPTNGYARMYSGVSLISFLKLITFQEITDQGIKNLAPFIKSLAEAEDLSGHQRSVDIRLNKLKNG
jgi:histidinol dehydrogenase